MQQASGSKTIREITTHSAEETIAFGHTLVDLLTPPKMVLLRGDLGAGKTTLVKGIALPSKLPRKKMSPVLPSPWFTNIVDRMRLSTTSTCIASTRSESSKRSRWMIFAPTTASFSLSGERNFHV